MAEIKNHSLFVVQTNEVVNSIKYQDLREEIAPLATADNSILGTVGQPGLMFPGSTMVYDLSLIHI